MVQDVVNDVIEALVWRSACTHYSSDFQQKLSEALGCFKRTSGMNDLTRLHASTLGNQGLTMLSEALAVQTKRVWSMCHGEYIEMRWELRVHLKLHLQRCLVQDGHATLATRDDYFSADLGLRGADALECGLSWD